MDSEILQSVLREILEEQKETKQAITKLTSRLEELGVKTDSFNEKLLRQKTIAPAADTRVIQDVVKTGVEQIQEIISRQPKSVVRQFRFLLFPELYADSYYRIVFGRLLFWMMIFLVVTYLFMLGKQGIESGALIKQKEAEINPYKKAWIYLYQHEKKFKPKMDSAWVKSW